MKLRGATLRAGQMAAALLVSSLLGATAATAAPLAHATRVGAARPSASLHLVFPLAANDAGLQRFAHQVSSPKSKFYGHYESISRLARRYGASVRTRHLVAGYLRSVGARRVKIDATGLFAYATVSAGLADRLFSTSLEQFRTATGARFISPAAGVAVPGALQGLVRSVIGLDTEPLATPGASINRASPAVRLRAAHGRFTVHPGLSALVASQPSSYLLRTGTPRGCAAGQSAGETGGDPNTAAFTPNQYLTAYGFDPLHNAGYRGQGVRVALIEVDGYRYRDLQTFAHCFGLDIPALTAYGVGVQHALAPGPETTLDLQVLDSAAPDLKAIDVYESKSSIADALRALTAPLQNPGKIPQVISASLGLCEPVVREVIGRGGLRAAESAFAMVAAAGTSFLASSGDQGAEDCRDSHGNPAGLLAVNYPSSSPWITGVGGTNIELNSSNNLAGQLVWNDTSDQPGSAGGGGHSVLFGRPFFQHGFVSGSRRVVPDVALLADLVPGYAIYCTAGSLCQGAGSGWQSVGGTSAATPLLAGGVALADQAAHAVKRQAVGFLNPLLYAIANSSRRSAVFSDVTAFGNDVGPYVPSIGHSLGCCTAAPGFDAASGFGSVNVYGLAATAIQVEPPIETISIPGHQHPIRRGKLQVKITCSLACRMGAFGEVRIAGKHFFVYSRAYKLRHGGHKTIALPFSAQEQRRMRSALRHRKRVTLVVAGVLVNSHNRIYSQTLGKGLILKG